jgi:hypothetical protein
MNAVPSCTPVELAYLAAYGRDPCLAVRDASIEVLDLQAWPLSLRLFMMARLADRSRVRLRRDAMAVDTSRLLSELSSTLSLGTIARCAQAYAALAEAGPRAGFVLSRALNAWRTEGAEPLRALVRRVLACDRESELTRADSDESDDPSLLVATYRARRSAWQAQHGQLLDEIFTEYARKRCVDACDLRVNDLLFRAQELILCVSLLRFLVLSHPALGEPDAPNARATLERVASEVVRVFDDSLDHDPALSSALDELLSELKLGSVADTVLLLEI